MLVTALLLREPDPIIGSLIGSSAFHGWWAIFWFLGFAVSIFVCAKLMSDFVEEISLRVKVSRAFLGGVVLASVTSVPETISGIFGGINNEVTFPLFNEIGSNSVSSLVMCFMLLATCAHAGWHNKRNPNGKQAKMKGVSDMGKSNVLAFRIVVVLSVLMVIFVNVEPVANSMYIPGIRMSVFSFMPIGCFLGFSIWSFMHKDEGRMAKRKDVIIISRFKNWSVRKVWIMFTLVAVALVVLAYFNANVVESFSDSAVLGIPESSAAGIMLAFSDGMPEITSVSILMWRGHTAIAIGNVAGSHLYNLSQIFFTDAIGTGHPRGSFAQINELIGDFNKGIVNPETVAAHQLIGITPMFALMGIFLTMQTFKRISQSTPLTLSAAGSTIASYAAGFAVSTTLL